MTLNIGICILQMRRYQKSVDTALRPQGRCHGCRHPPPSVRPNQFSTSKLESASRWTVPTLQSSLLKVSPWWLCVTPPRKTPVNPGVHPPAALGPFKVVPVAG
jgi:hypothetical protein